MDDQGMRDGKGAHTIRDSCYHRKKGAKKTKGKWQQTRQRYDKSPTSKICSTLTRI